MPTLAGGAATCEPAWGAPTMGSAMRRKIDRLTTSRRIRRARGAVAGAATLALAFLTGCGGPPPVKDVSNPDPSGKIPAIVQAAKKGDRRVLNQLVKDLDNDDPAVRFYAIRTLEQLTGERLGFVYFDDEVERKPALARWSQWLAGHDPKSPAQADGSK